MIFLQLFLVFIQIGIFGFGGGYSMISLIQGQVVTQYHWMTMQEFTDVVAISQMTPGPIGINAATYCGYTAVHNAGLSESMAILGSAVATFALVLPSLILMILISKMLYKYMNTTAIQSIFIGLRPAIVARRSCRLALDEPRKLLISCRPLAILYIYRSLPCHLLWCQVCRHQPHPHDMLLCFCRIAVAVLTEINFSETERTFNISTKE